jgi:hypothetical protein
MSSHRVCCGCFRLFLRFHQRQTRHCINRRCEICVIALKIFLFCGLRSLMANSALDSTYKHVEWHCKLSSLSPCVVVGPVGDWFFLWESSSAQNAEGFLLFFIESWMVLHAWMLFRRRDNDGIGCKGYSIYIYKDLLVYLYIFVLQRSCLEVFRKVYNVQGFVRIKKYGLHKKPPVEVCKKMQVAFLEGTKCILLIILVLLET